MGIGTGAVDLEPVPNDALIVAESFEPAVIERRDLGSIKGCKGAPVSAAAVEDGRPGKAGLGAFESKHLEQVPVVVRWDAPFAVVVVAHGLRAVRPRASPRNHLNSG